MIAPQAPPRWAFVACVIHSAADPPSSPGTPEVKDKTKNSITLTWSPPDRDGGSPIKGYIIEVHEEGCSDWRRVNPTDKLHPSNELLIPDLKEGKPCKFRIYAVNAAGNSEPARSAEILTQDILIEPTVTLDVSAHDLLNCRAASTIRIPATITGRPLPKVTWTFDGTAETEKKDDLHTLPVDSEIHSSGTTSVVTIPVSKLTHSGRYIINAESPAGHKVVKVRVAVLDLPGPPRELKVSDVTRGTCRLTWKSPLCDGGERVKSYFIEKKTVNGKAWTKVNPACAAQSLVVPDLINGQEYLFRIRAENRFGFGPFAQTIEGTKARDPINPPDPPTRLKIQNVRKDNVTLTWKAPKNDGGSPVTHYSVDLLCWDASGTQKEHWRRCNRRDVESTKFKVEDLTQGDEYEFRVVAYNVAGPSRPSTTAGPIVVQDQSCAPSIELQEFMEVEQGSDISIVAKIRGCPFPTLTWYKAPPHKSDSRVEVEYDEHINKMVSDDSCTLLIQQGKRPDTGLYTLTASNSLGKASKEIRLNVLGRPGPPSAPIKFEEIGAEKITLSWLPPKDDGGSKVTNYVIWRRVANRKTWVPVTSEPKERIWTVENLMTGHEYVFRIMAQNKYGVGEPLDSEPEVARDLYTVPGQCEKPTVTNITMDSMTINWEEPEEDGGTPITGYWLERKETTGKRWTRVTRDPIRPMGLGESFVVTGLIEGSEYLFRVTAINAAGPGPASPSTDPVFARDPVSPPSPPIPKVSDWSSSTVDLTWIPPLKDGGSKILGYWVEYKEEGVEAWVKAKDTEIRGTRFVITGLKTGGQYRFRVTAFNVAGRGEPGEVPEVLEVNDRTIGPEVDLDASVKERMVVHAGGVIRIIAYVSGQPTPEIIWSRDGSALPLEAKVETTVISSALIIKPCSRKHLGVYTLTAKNAGGEKTKTVTVEVLDVPGPVGIPFTAENLSSDSCKLNWFFPENDGGSPISNYVVEKREAERKAWTSVSFTASRTNAVAHGLTNGKSYFFRVAAENAIGIGPFMETAAEVVIKEPISVPDRPEELEVTRVTKDLIGVTWKPPKSDGGSEVTMYILEARMIGKDKYSRLTKEKLLERKYTYDGLREGDTYEFRVLAVNEVGPSKPSFCTKPITCKDELEPPTIELDFRDKIIIRVGESCLLQGRYTGKPPPSIAWYRDDEEVKADKHVMFKNTVTTMSLGLMKAQREHSGRYVVVVENSTGSRKGVCKVTVVDRPTPPVGPVIFEEVHREYMIISWKPPLDSGGVDVSNYIIEKRDTNRDMWTTVTSATTKTTCKIPKLTEGREYIMRISAENMYGISDPLESEEMRAKDLFRVPEAPEMPTVREVYATNALVLWNRPRDGGKPITNYILEKKETTAKRWSRATREPLYPATQFRVQDLVEGCEYEFRVMAENELGTGDPSEPSKPILAKDPIVFISIPTVCPSPPVTPEAYDKTKDSVSLKWKLPRHDGKGRIFGYLVEYKKPGSVEWIQANESPEQCPNLDYVVTGLNDGQEYVFRIFTVNAAGKSDPAYIKEPIKVHDRLEEPELLLDANMARDHLAMLGTDITLSATIKGVPTPVVSWKKNSGDVPSHVTVLVTATSSKVFIPKNLVVSEVTSESAYLTWKAPEDNGGAVISHYVVEKKDVAAEKWVPVSAANKKLSLMAMYLIEGIQYLFRVAAENQFGRSEYVVTKTPVKAVDPLYPPGPPKNLHHTDADKTEVWLAWEWPDRTGGSEITGFILEYQEDGQTDWLTYKTVSNNHAHVTSLEEGKTYRYRVKAQNAIGVSRPDTSVPITCQEKTLPPTIQVDVKLIEGVVAKAGTTILLPAKMTGIPSPTAKWMTDGKEIISEGRCHVETAGSSTILTISECQRGDTGEYVLTVSNPAGSKTVALHVTVLDLPGPPVGPINILEVTPDYMMIQWRAPKDDGGTPVTNYVVEKKDVKKPWEPWSVVSSSGTSTKAKVSRLEKGREYVVRVRAENKIGIGTGLESPPTIAKHMFNPPGPPGLPVCSDITENAVTVEWTLPDYDGGSPISGYVIERREMTGKWIRVNKTPVLDLRYRVSGLFEGNSYEFRVFAENVAGISDPSLTSDPIKATRAITRPGPPGNPKLKDWSKSYADICWTKPTRDGGSPVLGYVVEAQKSGSAQWDRINKDLIKICAYRVPGLIEGMEYRFRIKATNKVGESEPRELAETVLAKDILVPPEVVVDVSCRESLTIRAGQILNLITRVKGRPDPEITWTKDARALSRDKRTEINSNHPLCELVISDAVRSDYGKYAIVAKNSSGQAQATIIVNVLDTPGACQNLKVTYVTKNSSMVSWENPEDNGGTEITQYIIECRQPSQRGWTLVSNDCTKRLFKAPLTEGCEYFFRVSAENKIGAGPFTETKTPVLAVDPIEKPGEPIDFHISEIGKTFCFLKWKKPDYDGGSRNLGYHVEKKPKEAEEWERLHKGAIKETHFMADRCIENQMYQFRVQTKNEGGESNWVTTAEVLVKEQIVEPEIKIKLDGTLVVKAGDSIPIEANVKGKPQPDVKWTKDDSTEEIKKTPRVQIEIGPDFSKLLLTGARRTDSGKYVVSATNSAGSCSAFAKVSVLDKPGPIRDLKVSGITNDRCHVSWEVPEDDGGCDIYNYIIEKCETKRGVWSVHSNAVITNKTKVTRLIEGNEYIFRVRAENKMGPGPAVQSEAIVAGTQFSVPDAPETPEVIKIAKEEMTLQWSEPEKDGGKPITGYLLEKREEHAVRWSPVNKDPTPATRFTVTGILPLHDYQYRVKAVNEIGISCPSKSTRAVTAKDAVGPPAPPSNLKVLDSTRSTVTLGWTKPASTGGAPIIGYVVEMRPQGSAKKGDDGWKRCNVAAQLVVCNFTVTSLDSQLAYEFRVSAQNQVGMSLPCDLKEAVIPKEILEAPEIDLDAKLKQGLTVRATCPIRLCATVRGRPPPKVAWRRMGIDNVVRKGKVDIIDTMTFLLIPDSTRDDSGKYCLTVQSPAGEKAVFVNVKVLDSPGPVMNLEATDIKQTSAMLSWTPPENDGGSEILHYVVEKREIDRKTWATVKAEVERDKIPYKVSGLTPGTEYYFRVTAVNEYGSGVPRVSATSYLASDPVSKPDPCERIEVLEITRNSATVGWVKPARDGGAKIDGYVIEYTEVKPPPEPPAAVEVPEGEPAPPPPPQLPDLEDEEVEPEKEVWNAYTTVKDLKISVSGLKEGKRYKFRVAAKNIMGLSLFTETREPVEIKEQMLEPTILMPESVSARAGAKLRSGNLCVLIIKDVSRTDSGQYSLVAENSSAKVTQPLKIIIRDIPGPPEGPVVISDIDADACSLSWNKPLEDGGSNITNYVVEKCDVSRGDWVTAVSSVSKTSCRLGKLIPGKEYVFRIRAENRFGLSDPIQSDRMVAKFPFDVPSEPLNCRINKTNKDCMFVAWDKPKSDGGSPITGYYIERKERNSLLWVKANDTVVRTTEYPCAGLIEGLEYTFRVSAINRAGQGKPSAKTDFVTARTPVDTPGKPEILDVTKNSVTLVWTRPKNDGGSKIIGYYVEAMQVPGDSWIRCNTSSQNVPKEEYTVTNLERDLQYQFRVIAKTAVNISKPSEPTDPTLVCAENVPPRLELNVRMQKGLKVKAGATVLLEAEVFGKPMPRVTWRRGDDSLKSCEGHVITHQRHHFQLEMTAVTKEQTGMYTILAENASGSKTAEIELNVLDVPSSPVAAKYLDVLATSIKLSWEAPLRDGGAPISNYIVDKRETSRANWAQVSSKIKGDVLELTVEKLIEGHEYQFRIRAENIWGVGDPLITNPVIAKNPFTVPGPPEVPVITNVTKEQMTVSWREPADDGKSTILGYILEKKETKDLNWTKVNRKPITERSLAVTGLTEGAEYEFRVLAVNVAGVAPPGPIVNPSVIDTTHSTISLTWTAPASDGGSPVIGYLVECKRANTADWIRCNIPRNLQETSYVIQNLIDKNEYQCRITAVNKVGFSEPVEVPGKHVAKDIIVAPEAVLSAELKQGLELNAGATMKLEASIKGRPTPKITWAKMNTNIKDRQGISIKSSHTDTIVTVENVNRYDAGKYILNLESVAGMKMYTIVVKVYDTPGPPVNLMVKETSKDSASIFWDSPLMDGGHEVTHYIVEKRDTERKAWSIATNNCNKTSFKVPDLNAGRSYCFRVSAVNKLGAGEYCETADSVRASEEPGAVMDFKTVLVTKDSCTLSWKKPLNDGGSRIICYVLEVLNGDDKYKELMRSKNMQYSAKDLVEGKEYTYRVKAINDSGEGAAKELKVFAKDQIIHPNCDLRDLPNMSYIAKEGSTVRLKIPIIGKPIPKVSWKKGDDEDLKDSGRVCAESSSVNTTLLIRDCQRNDASKYTITLRNSAGTKESTIFIRVVGKPGIPSGTIKFKEVTADGATLKWGVPKDDGGSEITNYILEKRDSVTNMWVTVSSSVETNSMRVTGLHEGTEYIFRVCAENKYGVGEGLKSDPIIAKHPFNVPEAPPPPQIMSMRHNCAYLAWSDPRKTGGSPITGYHVEFKERNSMLWKRTSPAPLRMKEHSVTGLTEGLEYEFRVMAINLAGTGKPSAPTDPQVALDPIDAPGKPDVVSITKSTVTLQWTEPQFDGGHRLTGYVIERRDLPSKIWMKANNVNVLEPAFTVTDLQEGCKYEFRIRAKNAAGAISPPSEQTDTIICRDEYAAPTIVIDAQVKEGLTVRAGDTIVITATSILGKPAPTSCWSKGGKYFKASDLVQLETSPTSSTLSIKYATRKDTGDYVITASNPFGVKEETVKVTVLDVPDRPGPIECSGISSEKVALTWTAPTEDGGSPIKYYTLEKRETSRLLWTILEEKVIDCHYVAYKLIQGNEYFFRVSAVNQYGTSESSHSEAVKMVDRFGPPGPPSKPEVEKVDGHSATVTWRRPTDDGGSDIIGYCVEKKEKRGTRWVRASKTLIAELTFEVTGLTEDIEYEFRVLAENRAGFGEPSEPSMPAPTPPESIIPTTVTKNSGPVKILEISRTYCVFAWETPDNDGGVPINNYVVEIRDTTSQTWTELSTTVIRTIYKAIRLIPGSEYQFRVKAKNRYGVGPSITSEAVVAAYPFKVPGPPGTPSIVAFTKDSITIGWNEPVSDGGNEVIGYHVERKERSSIMWYKISKSLVKGNIFKSTGLEDGVAYEFRVMAENMAGVGKPSKTSEAILALDPVDPPGQPVPIHVNKNVVTIQWSKPEYDGGFKITGYTVEKRELPTGRWIRANFTNIIDTTFTISGLTQDASYEFRVIARNSAGAISVPSEPSGPITCKDDIVEPRIMVDAIFKDVILVKSGETFRLDADIAGQPTPCMVWTKNGKEIENTMKLEVKFTEFATTLTSKDSVRSDGGEFVLTATNAGGYAKHIFKVKVLDRPGPPVGPLELSNVTAETCLITWAPPTDDGGAEIQGYVIEKRESSRIVWTNVVSGLRAMQYKSQKLNLKPQLNQLLQVDKLKNG
ncbi:Titin [Takifugu flavidus]|uniref:Titin n=1 Tax=Takifugu flavidus TaxID=433684 RepID=A0A5C6PMX3_9TELE|nr:Titin [Takifugu flavidus]